MFLLGSYGLFFCWCVDIGGVFFILVLFMGEKCMEYFMDVILMVNFEIVFKRDLCVLVFFVVILNFFMFVCLDFFF